MTSIKLVVTGVKVRAEVDGDLTSGMVGIPVTIEYDDTWQGLTKNLVCRCSHEFGRVKDSVRTIVNVGSSAKVAHEIMQADMHLYLGIEGYSADGSLIVPTRWAKCGLIFPGAQSDADRSADPTLPVWAQLENEITCLKQSTFDEEHIEAIIENYLTENPITVPDSPQSTYELPVATSETLGGIKPVTKTETMTQPVGVDESGALYTEPGGSDYLLPVGGEELGGVKNGGNVVINEDGTMTAPESTVTDEQVENAVSGWLEANPDKVTTVQDGSITQEKLADELIEKLELAPNHHLTEEIVNWGWANWANDETWIEPKTTQSNQMITPLIRMPQYLKIVNNTGGSFNFKKVRITDSGDYDAAVAQSQRRGYKWLCDSVADGETLVIPTHEIGDGSRAYLQLLGNWTYNMAQTKLEIYAIYDSYRRTYVKPNDENLFLEDLPVRWVIQGYLGTQARLYGIVPYYPNFTYNVRGGAYETTTVSTVRACCLFDEAIFEGYQSLFFPTSAIARPIPYYDLETTQYDTSVNGGANTAYQWAYLTTPAETEITPKWIAFEMMIADASLDDEGRATAIQAINDGTERNRYITRWAEQMPRRIFTQIVKRNEAIQDEGTRYRALIQTGDSPLVSAKWVLFGDSLTAEYGGKDYGSEKFASKIAREFGMVLDNRAKSGSNIYAGGSGNYTAVSGIVKLDEYLAEIEAGTTEQADYITVAFGTNTFTSELGTNDDTSETNTSVYGATKYFIEKIREKVPNAVLGFVLSPRQDWGSAELGGYRNVDGGRAAIKAVCDDYGVPYIDMSTQSGITVDMLPDGIHISNDQSQKLYYHAMRRFMMGL